MSQSQSEHNQIATRPATAAALCYSIFKNWAVRDRLAGVHPNPYAQYLIARGARMARWLDAEFFAVHVDAVR